MACCQKRRKQKIKQLMKRRMFESEGFSSLGRMKRNHPSMLQDKSIEAYHTQAHELYKRAVKQKPPNKVFIHQVVELHDSLTNEMLKRRIKHSTPITRI